MKDKACYELSPSQDVSYLQCRYSLFKRVINIVTSITIDYDVDFELMEKAFNLVVERNDCLRIKFFKKNGKLLQYFEDSRPYRKLPVITFDSEEKQNAYIQKQTKRAIKYLHGSVIEPHFIKSFDGKNMILFKVCHLSLDVYGITYMIKDLLAVYESLKNGTELPPEPASFEEIIKKDIERNHNMSLETKHVDFFRDMLNDNPEPYYVGIHGSDNKYSQKMLGKHHRGMQMSFIKCDTKDYRHTINSELSTRVLEYCRNNKVSPANFMFYACTLTAARLNGNARNALPLGLYNCRVSQNEKNCAGTKVQSIACYSKFNYKQTFEENLKRFAAHQSKLYMHVGFSDRSFETLLHNTYRTSVFETYYCLAFSFVPMEVPEGIDFNIYSNGKGALAAYLIQIFNAKTNEITMAYDVQTKTTSKEKVAAFHAMYVKVLEQILNNPQIQLRDITLE